MWHGHMHYIKIWYPCEDGIYLLSWQSELGEGERIKGSKEVKSMKTLLLPYPQTLIVCGQTIQTYRWWTDDWYPDEQTDRKTDTRHRAREFDRLRMSERGRGCNNSYILDPTICKFNKRKPFLTLQVCLYLYVTNVFSNNWTYVKQLSK